ncbi:MAG: DUF1440 domain-containing protein [Brachybacterium sp.]|nr:DUF1440 domain-containing protein [Brachybacterium sp.]
MTAHTLDSTGHRTAAAGRRTLAGALGGIAGGLVFGMMMARMGMLTMIAGMMGSSSAGVGFGIHMMISIVFGIGFSVLAARWLGSWGRSLLAAVVYGIVLWVFGPLLVMPMMMGTAVFAVTGTTMMSLMGHLIYALITAAVTVLISRRRA